MPYHLNEAGNTVLGDDGKPVPGGVHKTHEEAVKHLRALYANVPDAKKKGIRLPNGAFDAQKAISEEERNKIPDEDFVDPQNKRFYIRNASDVMDAVQSYGRANPKIPYDKFRSRLTAIARRKGFESSLPKEWKQDEKKSPVDEQDPNGYVGTGYVDGPKQDKKASWLDDPTDEDIYQWLVNDDMGDFGFKSKLQNIGNGIDQVFYHHSPENYQYHPAMDWNDDTTPLPDVWVRAHPYGTPYKKDAHGEFFSAKTDFHEKDAPIESLPVTYYHNYRPDGQPMDKPTVIGKTIGRKYLNDGRWDKIQFFDKMPTEIRGRLANALARGTLRASPTVIPDIHKVDDRSGHITDWATGSIAVLDANGERQPASPLAIGIPQMKALFKAAHIPFPKYLKEVKMGNSKMKGAPTLKARMKATLKAMLKALGEDVEEWEETPEGEAEFHEEMTEEEKKKALFENSNPEESGQVPYGLGGNYWTDKFNGITESGRVDGAARESVQKDVQGLANVGEPKEPKPEQNELGDSDVRLDWARQEKAMKMMKAQVIALQHKSDEADFAQWFGQQLAAGKVMPAERDEVHGAYMQALSDDRLSHPVMKSANGQTVSRVRMIQRTIESREPRFGEKQLTPDMMKALGYQLGGFDQTPTEQAFNDKRREELLNLSPLGAKILQDNKRK